MLRSRFPVGAEITARMSLASRGLVTSPAIKVSVKLSGVPTLRSLATLVSMSVRISRHAAYSDSRMGFGAAGWWCAADPPHPATATTATAAARVILILMAGCPLSSWE